MSQSSRQSILLAVSAPRDFIFGKDGYHLDALGVMDVSSISFLSGLTVLSMSVISVFRQRNNHLVELRIGSLLAVGAVAGGVIGNFLFQKVKELTAQDAFVGMVQAIVLAIVTLLTLVYSAFFRNRLPSYHVKNGVACVFIGGSMGVLSSFLGIGGGPILFFAFSMETKKAAANSLYIIMFSQLASFLTSLIQGTIPQFPWIYLVIMVSAGVLGGMSGSQLNRRISSSTTDKLFSGLLCVIILICLYTAVRFAQ